MNNKIDTKVALVTGGAAGIGASTAVEFAKHNIAVVIADISEKGEQIRDKITALGGSATFIKCDVAKHDDHTRLMQDILKQYGRLDYAFNNAGVEQVPAKVADVDEATWDQLININLKGVWLGMKLQIPLMLKQGSGSIVNNASVVGLKSMAEIGIYNCSKAAVVMLTRTAAREYAQHGLRINAICPGLVMTDMATKMSKDNHEFFQKILSEIPMKRGAQPEEIAKQVVWLAKDASYITGESLVSDGGWLA